MRKTWEKSREILETGKEGLTKGQWIGETEKEVEEGGASFKGVRLRRKAKQKRMCTFCYDVRWLTHLLPTRSGLHVTPAKQQTNKWKGHGQECRINILISVHP